MKISEQTDQGRNLISQVTSKENGQSTRTFGETVRFGLVGVTNMVVDFILFLLLTNLWNWNVLAAQTVSYLFGLVNSYVWNRKITF